jgi:hypothetical protein
VIAAAQASLDDLFAPHNMAIGQRLYSSQLEQALMVPGAVAVQRLQVLEPGRIRRTRFRFFERWLGLRLDLFPTFFFEPELFSGPVDSADPGEGAFFALSGTPSIAQVSANG